MTAALLWKEYRQQRAVWLAIAILAVLLLVILATTTGRGSGLEVFQDPKLRGILNTVVFTLMIAYGLVSGALLLAGESDEGTLAFLDSLTGRRGAVWARKCVAGVILTLAQSMVLGALALVWGFGSWTIVIALPFVGLGALAWGLLGGALCSTVLSGVLTAIAFMAASWLLSMFSINALTTTLLEAGSAIAAGYASRRVFCRDDVSRQPIQSPRRLKTTLPPGFLAQWRVLLWLALRQGRWVLAACLGGALLLAFTVNLAPLVLWPLGTMLLGLTCGLAVFAPDQLDRNRFLGAQRFPPGRLWTAKTLVWAIACLVLTAVLWLVVTALLPTVGLVWQIGGPSDLYSYKNAGSPTYWLSQLMKRSYLYPGGTLDAITLLTLWPLYGFCFGQFFGQLARRPVIALILTTFVAPLIALLWVPSLIIGGLPAWQIIIVPVLLLLTTRLTLRPWLGGRLMDVRPLIGIGAAAALMVMVLAGCLWYRAVEVPDIGEPFDVKAFVASLPTPEKNEAGPMIRNAALTLARFRIMHRQGFADPASDVLAYGWPKKEQEIDPKADRPLKGEGVAVEVGATEQEIGRWFDRLFEGAWAEEARKAAGLPLGMVQDPRGVSAFELAGEPPWDYVFLGEMFAARALQIQAQGDSRGALNHLETALGLSRQLRNFATDRLLRAGTTAENAALAGLFHWLEKVGPDRDKIKDAQAMLQRHQAAVPDPANSIKADYLVLRNYQPPLWEGKTLVDKLDNTAVLVPWEKARQSRIFRAMVVDALGKTAKPEYHWLAILQGLPPAAGPGSDLSAKQWSEFINQLSRANNRLRTVYEPRSIAQRSLQHVRAAEIITALTLYQTDHGGPPQKLEELVPAYLLEVPNDPQTGQAFRYGICRADNPEGGVFAFRPSRRFTLAPGQAFLGTWSPDLYPVPVWGK